MILLLFLMGIGTIALMANHHQQIYQSFIRGTMEDWKDIIDQLETQACPSISCRYDLIECYYGYTGYLIRNKQNQEAKTYIEKAEAILKSIQEEKPEEASVYAYFGSFLGLRMQIEPLKIPVLGPKSHEQIETSIELDPENTQGLIEKANSLFHTPEMFGGSKKEAIKYYIKALKTLEKAELNKSNWLYMKTLVDLAMAYDAIGHPEQAIKLYKRILYLEPEFKLVKEELYPDLVSRMQLSFKRGFLSIRRPCDET